MLCSRSLAVCGRWIRRFTTASLLLTSLSQSTATSIRRVNVFRAPARACELTIAAAILETVAQTKCSFRTSGILPNMHQTIGERVDSHLISSTAGRFEASYPTEINLSDRDVQNGRSLTLCPLSFFDGW